MNARRAVVTGIGVIAPGGTGRAAFWDLLCAGRTATRPISTFDATGFRSRIAAECEFDPFEHGLDAHAVARMDRAAQFAVATVREALADSGLDPARTDPARTGVSIGSAVGATIGLEDQFVRVSDHGRRWIVDPALGHSALYDHLVPSSFAKEVAWASGAEGPVATISTGCTSGIDAIGHAMSLIAEGSADVVLAGATEAPISPISLASFDAIRATSPNNDNAATASRPFDLERDGFVLGEGAAVLVVEELRHAVGRGAHVYAELAGYANRANAFHMTGLKPDGREMGEAITVALDRARLPGDAIGYINAHGSGTRQNDRHETAAFKRSLGHHAFATPVSSIKSMVGHSLGAIGSIEIAACALALAHGVIPPTANLHTADPECDLDYVPITARESRLDNVLTVGSGFGGFQSAMVLSRVRCAA